MRISKTLLLVCAAGCALLVRGADTEAQLKAREALQKKLNEAQGGVPQATQPVTAAAQPKAPASLPPAAAPAVDSSAIEKAREAVRQRMQQVGVETPTEAAPAPAPVAVPAPAPKTTPAPRPVQVAEPAPALPSVPAADPDAIAKAREAMRQKLEQVEGQPAPAVAAPSAPLTPVPAPKPAKTAAPAVAIPTTPTPEPIAPPVVALPQGSDPVAIEKAREAMRQKWEELQSQPAPAVAATPATPTAPAVPAVPTTTVPPTTAQAAPTPPQLVPEPALDEASMAKARDAMRSKMNEAGSQPVAQSNQSNPPRKVVRPPAYQKQLDFPRLEGPALNISPEKQQQLRTLLEKYQRDEISPEQYHAERAKILGN